MRKGLAEVLCLGLTPCLGSHCAKHAGPDTRRGDHAHWLGEGTTPRGAFYLMRSFEVRVGFSSGGRSVHTFKPITRVYAALPLDAGAVLECTGYIEHGVESQDDPTLRAVRDVCSSMRHPR